MAEGDLNSIPSGAALRDQHASPAPAFLPLSERAFLLLPGPWLVWAVLWSGLGPFCTGLWLKAFAFDENRPVVLVTWGLITLVCILVAKTLSRDVAALRSVLQQLTGRIGDAALEPFAGLGRVTGPALMAAMSTAVYLPEPIRRAPFGYMLGLVGSVYITNLALYQGVWAMVVVLRGLDALGKQQLRLLPFEVDPSLGLRPLGQLAFKVFLTGVTVSILAVLTTATTPSQLAILVLTLLVIVATFFLSMYRLHQQLVSEKTKLRAWSRQMTAVAVAPLKREATTEGFQAHSPGVLAADTIARQVGAVQEWPVDERVLRVVATITTSVAAAVFARLLLTRIGL